MRGRRLRVLTVDDEPLAREGLRMSLATEEDVELVGECPDGERAVEAILALAPDLVYLDVQMPGLDGFGVIERVGPERMPAVIFVTAYEEHALRAFEVHAIDYLLKPVEEARFREALMHARRRIGAAEGRDEELGRRLVALLEERRASSAGGAPGTLSSLAALAALGEGMAPGEASPERSPRGQGYASWITVVVHQARRLIRMDDVDWFEAEGNYVRVQVGAEEHLVRISLTGLLERLDPAKFVRIHRSVVVNLVRVRTVEPWVGGDYLAILHDGRQLRVSRSYKDALVGPLI